MTDQEVYEKTLKLFGGCCSLCGNRKVELHHIRYGAAGRKTYMGNVIPLCKRHHGIVHSNKRVYQPLLIEIINDMLGLKI